MNSWQGVNEFVAVAESESFTIAAKKLNTSVAQVSRRVATLEENLAVKLLLRTTRKVSLTEVGQSYFLQCKQLVEGLDEANLAVSQMQTRPKGRLKVTAPVTYGEKYLAPLLHQFLRRYPDLALELVLTNQQLDLVEQGVDLAIRLGHLKDSTLIAKRLSQRQLYVCATPQYISQAGEPHTLSELANHQCLLGTVDYWRFKELGKERSIRVSGRIKCNSGFALLDAAKQHLGLVQLPDYYVKSTLKSGELVEVLSDYRDDKEGIWAVYPLNRNLSLKMRLLIDFLADALSAGY